MNENDQAILLLTAQFSALKHSDVAPLGPAEYGRLASWLDKQGCEPRILLRDPGETLTGWSDPQDKITSSRLQALLNRGMAMAVALEKWLGAGLWVLTRADAEYPGRLRERLGQAAPALLFGAGNPRLLHAGGLAMVGSRDITDADRQYGQMIARQAAQEGLNIVSGGARGIDEVAMRSALEAGGTAVGVLADGLLKAAISAKWRVFITRHQLCLVSPFYPEATFLIGNAMARNKYVYCLSDSALVVQSAKGEGGTWAGATENLRNRWTSLYIRADSESPGLQALSALNAAPLRLPAEDRRDGEWLRASLLPSGPEALESPEPSSKAREQFYELFQDRVRTLLSTGDEIAFGELKERFPDLVERQLAKWLDRAVEDGYLERKSTRRIYRLAQAKGNQMHLFDN